MLSSEGTFFPFSQYRIGFKAYNKLDIEPPSRDFDTLSDGTCHTQSDYFPASRAAAPEIISISSVVIVACRVLQSNRVGQQNPKAAALKMLARLPTLLGTHLLYCRDSLLIISVAFFVELSMAAMRDACSLQLFSSRALYRVCSRKHSADEAFGEAAGVARTLPCS